MRAEKPSLTAQFVALGRALGDMAPQVSGFSDPIARRLLGAPYTTLLALAEHAGWSQLYAHGTALAWVVTTMEYRTVVLDEAIAAAPDFSQLVILGAGLDSRAWRLPRLAGKRVFEVDHPATQSWKKSQTQGLRSQADEVHFVPVDFERDKLSECLAKAGHSPNERTFWLWEGVTMYLDREAIGATLASAASRSAPGSTLALTYFCRPFPIQAFRWIGEPFRAHFKPAELETFAGRFGWGKVSDCGQADLEALVSPKGPFANTALWRKATHRWAVERIWVGRHGQAGPSKPTR